MSLGIEDSPPPEMGFRTWDIDMKSHQSENIPISYAPFPLGLTFSHQLVCTRNKSSPVRGGDSVFLLTVRSSFILQPAIGLIGREWAPPPVAVGFEHGLQGLIDGPGFAAQKIPVKP